VFWPNFSISTAQPIRATVTVSDSVVTWRYATESEGSDSDGPLNVRLDFLPPNIEVIVTDGSDGPLLAGAFVTLTRTAGGDSLTVDLVTDATGRATANVPSGTYSVRVVYLAAEGVVTQTVTGQVVPDASGVLTVPISLNLSVEVAS